MTDATPSNTPSTTEASSSRPDASTNGSNKNNAPKKRMSPRARFILRALGLLVLVYLYCALRNNFRFTRMGSALLCIWTLAGLFLSLELYRVLLFFVTVYALH